MARSLGRSEADGEPARGSAKVIRAPRPEPVAGFPEPRPAVRGRYLIRTAHVALAMGFIDCVVNMIPRSCPPIPQEPKRILVANWAHMGDLLTTLPAIDWLRRRYPHAEIGLLTGSWSIPIAHAAPELIDHIHVVDHFALARSGDRRTRLTRHREMARQARAEISQIGYDVALDFYAFFPTAAPFLAGTGIPVRIGWSSGGLGGLNTHQVRRRPADRHIIDYHRDILNVLAPGTGLAPGELRPIYPGQLVSLPLPLRDGRPFVVLQTGTGAVSREWSTDKWIALARRLAEGPHRVVLAGAGPREVERNARLAEAVPTAIDLTDKLNLPEFVSLIANCRTLYCLESVAGHVAAAFARPTVVISGGMTNPHEWGPNNPFATIITAETPCAPCNRSGCDGVYCLANVGVDDVWAAGRHAEGHSS